MANPDQYVEACRGDLDRWLKAYPDTGNKERSRHTVLEALETNGHGRLTEQLKKEHFGESSNNISFRAHLSTRLVCAAKLPRESLCSAVNFHKERKM